MLKVEPVGRVRVKKTAEIVASQIRNAIIRGELGDGSSLPAEAALIASFQVSRPTIREAIRILESEDLIRVSRGARGGALVQPPGAELVARTLGYTLQSRVTTLGDVYAARSTIEPPAARMAAENRPKQASTTLRAHVEKEYSVLADRVQIGRAVAEFHRLLVEQSGNKTLTLVVGALQEVSEKHLSLLHRMQPDKDAEAEHQRRTRRGLRSHEKLVQLIADGDAPGAEAHWEEHMRKASDWWLRGFGAEGLDVLE